MSGRFLLLPLMWLLSLNCLMNCEDLITGYKHKTPNDDIQEYVILTASDSGDPKKTTDDYGQTGGTHFFQQRQLMTDLHDSGGSKRAIHDSGQTKGTLLFQQSQLMKDASTMSWQQENIGESGMIGTESKTLVVDEKMNTHHDLRHEKLNYQSESSLAQTHDISACMNSNIISRKKHRYDGDTFLCTPCICLYQNKYILANCTHNRPVKTIPICLPRETRGIYLSGNDIKTLNLSQLKRYRSLFTLSITHNTKLRELKNVSTTFLPVRQLILDNNNIETVEDGSFQIMPALLELNLGYNKLHNITNFTFHGLCHLEYLNLSHNFIKVIEYGAFDRMASLLSLDLSRNKGLGYSKFFPPRLFRNLNQLQTLSIEGNSNGELSYPSEVLEKLPKLQNLSIDGLDSKAAFKPKVKSLKHLSNLKIGGSPKFCHTTYLNETFFGNLPNITNLSFRFCNCLRICNITKTIAKYLTTLEIYQSDGYDLSHALRDIRHFQNSSLTSLTLVHLIPAVDSHLYCRTLTEEDGRYLKSLKLELLDLSANFLAHLAKEFIQSLPMSLKRLILARNKFGIIGIELKKLVFLTDLIELDISYQNMEHYDATDFTRSQSRNHQLDINASSHFKPTLVQEYDGPRNCCETAESKNNGSEDVDCSCGSNKDTYSEPEPQIELIILEEDDIMSNWSMPPNLTIIRAVYCNYFGNNILHPSPLQSSLEEFYISHSLLSNFENVSVPKHVKVADLSNSYLDSINHGFFTPNNSIVDLYLRGNSLGPGIADDFSGLVFANLGQAKYVDISDNSIYSLPPKFFTGLQSVKTLKIGDNKLQNFNVSLSHMKSLRHLDLHKNSIAWISKETRQDLDDIASQNDLTIDLTSNPLPCTCDGLELLYWMANTNVYFMHQNNLICRIEKNVYDYLGDIEERVTKLQRYCAPKAEIIVICLACFVVLVMLVGFSIMYRYRWRLRYLRNVTMAKLGGYRSRDTKNHNYKFDAYVLFSDESRAFVLCDCLRELEVKRGHKLCINDRDFMPGTYEVSNIVGAIQHSAKTIAIVTPDFYGEEYSEYSVKMAVMEEIYNRRSVLHLCVYKPMTVDDMAHCPDLLMVMKRDDYTEFPPENQAREEIVQNFWDSLSLAIGHTNQVNALQDGFGLYQSRPTRTTTLNEF